MATSSRGRIELALMQKRNQGRETSPERTMVWVERKSNKDQQKVAVLYYLSRNGLLEHPHFIEVPLSSPQGLFLKDVIHRLNSLRGEGMANSYSWSSKRSYKNGFVWQDLSENDFIYPSQGKEYILKGSKLLETSLSFGSYETVLSSTSSISKNSSETYSSGEDNSNVQEKIRRKHHSWSEFDEQKIYKAKTSREFSSKGNSVSTQTDDNARQRRLGSEDTKQNESEGKQSFVEVIIGQQASGPSSNSSSEVSKSLNMSADIRDQSVENDRPSGRINASAVLMQLIACGSRRAKDCEYMEMKD